MWEFHIEQSSDERVSKYSLVRGQTPVAYLDVLALWQNDAGFRQFFNDTLADSPFRGFRWETRPITRATVDRHFEFVLLQSDGLDGSADATAFAKHFDGAKGQDVVTFFNLGGDAELIVPAPSGPASNYGHLASFVRNAPSAQMHHFWQTVGAVTQSRIGDAPLWLSTAGYGVSWLHVRLDKRPKYYGYAPYKNFS